MAPESGAPRQSAAAPLRVLVADDSPVQRLFVEHALRLLGHQALVASDGEEALQVCLREQPDVVLLDLEMPVLDGLGACRAIRAAEMTQQPGIVFVTASHDETELARCLDAGGDAFLTKPVSTGVLGAQLSSFARSRALSRIVQEQAAELSLHHDRMAAEQRIAREVFDRVVGEASSTLATVRWRQADASTFAGDLVLTAEAPSGVHHLLVADCTGHGLPAALAALPTATSFSSYVKRGFGPMAILARLNDHLRQSLPDGHFVAAALVSWDPLGRQLTVFNAGLPDVHLVRQGVGIVRSVPSMHPPLGVLPADESELAPLMVPAELEDKVLVVTDGVSEAVDARGERFGEARVRRALSADVPEAPLDAVHTALRLFSDGAPGDDITIAELNCLPPDQVQRQGRGEASTARSAVTEVGDAAHGRVALEVEAGALRAVDPLPFMSQLANALPVIGERIADVQVVLTELVANAVQHGVLGIPSTSKSTPEGFANFYREVRNRTAAIRQGWVRVELAHIVRGERHLLTISVSDSGEGFDVSTVRPADDTRLSGRGLHMVRAMSDQLRFLDEGRTVEATLSWQRKAG